MGKITALYSKICWQYKQQDVTKSQTCPLINMDIYASKHVAYIFR